MEMRRKDRELARDEAWEILRKCEYGMLAMKGEEYPYAVPVNYVVDDENIYIHGTSADGHKPSALRACDKVCFTVVGDTTLLPPQFGTLYESAVVFGTASRLGTDETGVAETKQALYLFLDKYSAEFKEKGIKAIDGSVERVAVYKIHVDEITGKARRK